MYLRSTYYRKMSNHRKPNLDHKKSLMFRMHRKIPPRFVCVSHGACLNSMLPGVQVTATLGFFCIQAVEALVMTVTLLLL